MHKLENNIFYKFNVVEEKISKLEETVNSLQEQLNESLQVQRSQLIKIKNNEDISDDTIYYGMPYNDLSPARAFKAYNRKDFNFILLDVSADHYQADLEFEDVLKIPLESLADKCEEFLNNKIPILVISEDGLRSIKACELLINKGFYNINNISGGHKFWPGARDKNVTHAKSA
ncbi:rhodanese-like domain-containing protein [Bacteriovoracaceae bacterium]|nr:rhodanese-like domain-containing protein [Bacteriovoracaceae bacterium]